MERDARSESNGRLSAQRVSDNSSAAQRRARIVARLAATWPAFQGLAIGVVAGVFLGMTITCEPTVKVAKRAITNASPRLAAVI